MALGDDECLSMLGDETGKGTKSPTRSKAELDPGYFLLLAPVLASLADRTRLATASYHTSARGIWSKFGWRLMFASDL